MTLIEQRAYTARSALGRWRRAGDSNPGPCDRRRLSGALDRPAVLLSRMVPAEGLEPSRPEGHALLRRARLPGVSPGRDGGCWRTRTSVARRRPVYSRPVLPLTQAPVWSRGRDSNPHPFGHGPRPCASTGVSPPRGGAPGRTRTCTTLWPPGFEPGASARSATGALFSCLAEAEGVEPPSLLRAPVFETGDASRSVHASALPEARRLVVCCLVGCARKEADASSRAD